ncbi:MAG: sodium/solute symporter [Armatimonadota bacterium]|nr:sodium/solute symporter [Armatimonadota bacterium]MDW8025535.1 sodium/solute symporter [Armatimonadota bacterium]
MANDFGINVAQSHFGLIDWLTLSLYFVGMLLIGFILTPKVKGARSFFIANGKMNHIAVGLSLLGTYLSALTMLALPAISFGKFDMLFSVQLPFLIVTAFLVTKFVLPKYREAGVISVYELFEMRIHVLLRLLASVSFISLSIVRMGLITYLTALTLHTATGMDLRSLIFLMGGVATAYTVAGGIEAVIWTDVVQVVVLVIGAVLSMLYATIFVYADNPIAIAIEHGKLRMFDWRIDFAEVVTPWLILETLFQTMRIYSTQQDMVQRYMTTESTAKANASVWIAILGYIPLGYFFYFLGVLLFVYYKLHPDPMVEIFSRKEMRDAVYPYFVVSVLPEGISGLIIAAIIAAAMSSIDSSMNSASTVCVEDFYKRFICRNASDRHYLLVARLLTLFWGALSIVMALCFIGLGYAQVAWNKAMGILTNGILALMVFALLPVRINWLAVLFGFLSSYGILAYVMLMTKLNFLLWTVIGNVSCFAIAIILHYAIKLLGTIWRSQSM